MFPYIDLPTLHIAGPLSIQPFGVLVAIGVLFGTWQCQRFAARYRMDEEDMRWLGMRCVVWGFIACHVVDVVFYTPEKLTEDPLILFKIWEGIASYGGFLGASVAFVIYTRIRGLERWRWADAIIYGAVPGMFFGRMACAVAHDHIGQTSDFFLAVDFPADRFPGQSAHDLGLYEMFLWLAMWGVMVGLERWKGRKPGTLLAVACILYAPPRFFFEFLRRPESDPRYVGLTFAQWAALFTLGFGIYAAVRIARSPRMPLEEPARDEPEAVESAARKPSAKPRSGAAKKKRRR